MNGDGTNTLPIVMILGATAGLLALMWPRKPKARPPRPPREPYLTREQWKVAGIAIVILVAAVMLWASTVDEQDRDPRFYQGGPAEGLFASDDPKGRPGKAEVYNRIEASTDCAELQVTFDRRIEDALRREPNTYLRAVVTGYAEAADARMREIGCFG